MALSPFTLVIGTKSDTLNGFNVIPNAPYEIRHRNANGSSGALANIFSDSAGLVPITQTGAAVDSRGTATFYAEAIPLNAEYNNGSVIVQPIDSGISNQNFISLGRVIPFPTLANAIADTNKLKIFDGAVLDIKGLDTWDVVLLSSVAINDIDKFASTGLSTLALVQRPINSIEGNLLWQGSFNVWQRGFAFDDFTSRVGVMDGSSFSRAAASDKEILVIQQGEPQRIQRIVGDTNTDACYLVINMDHEQTKVIAGKPTFFKTSIRGNALTGPVSIRVQYTTYSDLQKITAFDGVYDVGHNELVTQVITPVSGVETFELFDTILNIPSEAKQVALVFIYEPSGVSPAEEWIEFEAVSNTERPHSNITKTPFNVAIEQAQRQYRKSYAYDSFPRTASNFGALSAVSKGQDSLTDSIFPANFDISMLYAPTVTVRTPSGGGVGVTFYNETKETELTAKVNITSSKGFRIEGADKALGYDAGDFTPALVAVAAPTYTKQIGKYVKDGDLVYFTIEIEYSGLDLADTSDVQIATLPFGGADQNGLGSVNINVNGSTGFNLLSTDSILPAIQNTAGTIIVFPRVTGVNIDYNDGKMSAAGVIKLSGTYRTSEIYAMNTYSTHYEAEARL